MAMNEIEPVDVALERLRREAQETPLALPRPGQKVGDCHFSRTGYAIWEGDDRCTCVPTAPPSVSA